MTILFLFILGLFFGSFGSVLMSRLGEKVDKATIASVLWGRSQCPQCHTPLRARHLVPLMSFLYQRGQCAHCGKQIPYLYPILELASGLIFALSYWVFQDMSWGTIIYWTSINRLFLLLIVYDLIKYELHVPLWVILIAVIGVPQLLGAQGNYLQALEGVLVFVGGFLLIYWGAKAYVRARYHQAQEGFGQGDIYMSGAIGLLLPLVFAYQHMTRSGGALLEIFLIFLILSSVLGILLRGGITGLVRRTKISGSDSGLPLFRDRVLIPFIPAMILAFWILLLYADPILYFFFPLRG